MKFETACKKAMDFLKKEYGDDGFSSIMDLGDRWLFDGTDAKRTIFYGKPGVTIDKKSGTLGFFLLPDEKNFELLNEAIEVEIPKNYII